LAQLDSALLCGARPSEAHAQVPVWNNPTGSQTDTPETEELKGERKTPCRLWRCGFSQTAWPRPGHLGSSRRAAEGRGLSWAWWECGTVPRAARPPHTSGSSRRACGEATGPGLAPQPTGRPSRRRGDPRPPLSPVLFFRPDRFLLCERSKAARINISIFPPNIIQPNMRGIFIVEGSDL